MRLKLLFTLNASTTDVENAQVLMSMRYKSPKL